MRTVPHRRMRLLLRQHRLVHRWLQRARCPKPLHLPLLPAGGARGLRPVRQPVQPRDRRRPPHLPTY
ncbi:hypothetical protein SFR_6984 (plasmid) [Streptomyces sp. FR-008]|nr:hypothetical protein SFR_6984 [Streptomyces sp. FR-008]